MTRARHFRVGRLGELVEIVVDPGERGLHRPHSSSRSWMIQARSQFRTSGLEGDNPVDPNIDRYSRFGSGPGERHLRLGRPHLGVQPTKTRIADMA